MNANAAASGKRFVIVVDPHVANDQNYFFYSNSMQLEQSSTEDNITNIFLKQDDKNYVGLAWPGESVWVDFLNDNS